MPASLLAFLMGCSAGLRSLTPVAILCWAVFFEHLNLGHTKLLFLGATPARIFFTVLAVTELLVDKLPQTPARTVPIGLGARVVTGCLCGGVLGLSAGTNWIFTAIFGIAGAVVGTFAGYKARRL